MGFSYLDGKFWAQVTREERFFCQHLFGLFARDKTRRILSYVNDKVGIALPRTTEWEPAYEVCFYRDLAYLREERDEYFSPKRTFDLCLFSEDAIIILEAKAQQEFKADQMDGFEADREHVKKTTGVSAVWLCGLVSSKYKPATSISAKFDGRLLTWRDLAELYDDDEVLERANEVYDSEELKTWGKNNDGGYLSGEELIEAYTRGDDNLCVGRHGGLNGSNFLNDLRSGNWRRHPYETTRRHSPPNRNWFLLSNFAKAVERTEAETK